MKTKTCEIQLPGDLFADMQSFLDHAIFVAREEADDYVIPCAWTAEHTAGEIGQSWELTFKVTRISD